jgi:hypothetical protein
MGVMESIRQREASAHSNFSSTFFNSLMATSQLRANAPIDNPELEFIGRFYAANRLLQAKTLSFPEANPLLKLP